MRIATITREVHQSIRRINQFASGGSYVAIFTLRITPLRDSRDVQFGSEASDARLEAWMVSAIERGVRTFVAERQQADRPVGGFRVTLSEINVHPVDSKQGAFLRAAHEAMTEAFEAHETLVDVGSKNET